MRIWTKTRRHRITQSHMRRRLDLFLKSPLKTSRSTWTWSDSCGTRSGVHWSVCELIIKVWHSSALMSLFLWELESSRDASDNNHEKHISCHCVTPDPHSYSFFYSVCLVNYVRYYCVSSMSQRRRLSVNNNLNNVLENDARLIWTTVVYLFWVWQKLSAKSNLFVQRFPPHALFQRFAESRTVMSIFTIEQILGQFMFE